MHFGFMGPITPSRKNKMITETGKPALSPTWGQGTKNLASCMSVYFHTFIRTTCIQMGWNKWRILILIVFSNLWKIPSNELFTDCLSIISSNVNFGVLFAVGVMGQPPPYQPHVSLLCFNLIVVQVLMELIFNYYYSNFFIQTVWPKRSHTYGQTSRPKRLEHLKKPPILSWMSSIC